MKPSLKVEGTEDAFDWAFGFGAQPKGLLLEATFLAVFSSTFFKAVLILLLAFCFSKLAE